MEGAQDILLTHLTASGLTVWVLNKMKDSQSPFFAWITAEKVVLIRFLSLLAAAGTAAGIHATWNSDTHTLTITDLTLAAVVLALWTWAKQYVLNEIVFQMTKQKSTPPASATPNTGIVGGLGVGGGLGTAKALGALLLAFAIIFSSGCTPHVASTAGVPSRTATPLEKALAYNAGLAEANKTLVQSVMQANASNFLTTDQTNRLLSVQSRVADFDRQLTPLLVDTATISRNASKIQLLLNEIKIAATGVQGDLGIKDATTAKSISTTVNQVFQMADLTLTALQTGGLLQQ